MSVKKVMVVVRQLSKDTTPVAHAVINEPSKETLGLTDYEYENYLPEWFEEQAADIIKEYRSRFPEFNKATFSRYILENDGAGKFMSVN